MGGRQRAVVHSQGLRRNDPTPFVHQGIQQAYIDGVSTRRVDDLVKALGCEGISKSQVSRICVEFDGVVDSFLGRPLDGGPYCYVWLDAMSQKVREEGRIVNVSVARRGGL